MGPEPAATGLVAASWLYVAVLSLRVVSIYMTTSRDANKQMDISAIGLLVAVFFMGYLAGPARESLRLGGWGFEAPWARLVVDVLGGALILLGPSNVLGAAGSKGPRQAHERAPTDQPERDRLVPSADLELGEAADSLAEATSKSPDKGESLEERQRRMQEFRRKMDEEMFGPKDK